MPQWNFFLIKKNKRPYKQTQWKRDQVYSYRVGEWEEGELDEGGQKTQTTSYKISKY